MPATPTAASMLPEAVPTTAVPGQCPEMMNPAPRRRPPASWGHKNVSGTVTRERSSTPTPERSAIPASAVTIAPNMTFSTRRSVR